MLNIAIDRGNSFTKTGLFKNGKLLASNLFPNTETSQLMQYLGKYHPDAIIISSVALDDDLDEIKTMAGQVMQLTHHTNLPFSNLYKTPETLGKDRMAAVAGAQTLIKNENILIIDAGTAVTYDFITKDNQYLGGDITPGLNMRFKALNTFTHQLPLVKKEEPAIFPGQQTNGAIASGVINGMVFEMEGYCRFCEEKWHSVQTIITGGDSDFFVKKLKRSIFVNPNLVLIGLNRILEHNV
ncbi:type III pantothenate kinase [Geofilum sp. OHC36d9]|uniref:type III pantothenate kinase n=1 Tax=Geofilum sp. OHC36d9 TaxID=3458413 RepID=UPI004034ECC4